MTHCQLVPASMAANTGYPVSVPDQAHEIYNGCPDAENVDRGRHVRTNNDYPDKGVQQRAGQQQVPQESIPSAAHEVPVLVQLLFVA